MSLVGPNCFGVFNTDPEVGLNATFSESLPPVGNIAFVSQSGALGAGILAYAASERIGFSRFVSVGNRAGVDENDLLTSFDRDPRTRVILMYVESLASGRRFLEAAREVTERKPVLVIKSGRTIAGERAAKSHTGSLAQSGRDQLYDSVFAQAGSTGRLAGRPLPARKDRHVELGVGDDVTGAAHEREAHEQRAERRQA